MRHLPDLLRGLLMGSVYLVPGGDGGTVALVLGIYERLIASLHSGSAAIGALLRGRWADTRRHLRAVEWGFLVPLVIGIAIAAFTVASLIDDLLHDHPVATSAAFVGLVLGAAWLAWGMVDRWTPQRSMIAAITAVITFVALGVNPGQVEDPALVAFFLAGIVSLVALILPGFPGSTALITIGMYQAVVDAVADRQLAPLVAFGLGGVLCLAALSSALDRLLHSRHDAVVAGLVGLMVGSVRTLWPWQDHAGTMRAPVDWVGPLALAIAGFVVVAGVGWVAERRATGFPPPASGQQNSTTSPHAGW